MAELKYKVGDRLKIAAKIHRHNFEIGEEVKVVIADGDDETYSYKVSNGVYNNWVGEREVCPLEIKFSEETARELDAYGVISTIVMESEKEELIDYIVELDKNALNWQQIADELAEKMETLVKAANNMSYLVMLEYGKDSDVYNQWRDKVDAADLSLEMYKNAKQ